MECSDAMEQNMRAQRFTNNHIGAATAKESALAVWSDVDVDESGHCCCGGLNPLHVETVVSKSAAKEIAKFVLADGSHEARLKSPAGKRKRTVGSDAAYMHF